MFFRHYYCFASFFYFTNFARFKKEEDVQDKDLR